MRVARQVAVNVDFTELSLAKRLRLAFRILRGKPTQLTSCTVWWADGVYGDQYAMDMHAY